MLDARAHLAARTESRGSTAAYSCVINVTLCDVMICDVTGIPIDDVAEVEACSMLSNILQHALNRVVPQLTARHTTPTAAKTTTATTTAAAAVTAVGDELWTAAQVLAVTLQGKHNERRNEMTVLVDTAGDRYIRNKETNLSVAN